MNSEKKGDVEYRVDSFSPRTTHPGASNLPSGIRNSCQDENTHVYSSSHEGKKKKKERRLHYDNSFVYSRLNSVQRMGGSSHYLTLEMLFVVF